MTGYVKGLMAAVVTLGIFLLSGLAPSYAGGYGSHTSKADIVDTAIEAGRFNTLVAAVQAAGLVETLKGAGPFTVFAPTDEAFAKIPKARLDALLADKEALTAVLTYHVVPGKLTSAKVIDERLTTVTTVQGDSITIDARVGVKVNDANVLLADIQASNGMVHVIDAVILPPSMTGAAEARLRVAASNLAD